MSIKIEAVLASKPGAALKPQPKTGGSGFKDFIKNQQTQAVPAKDPFLELQQMQQNLLNSKEISGKDLILYQIKTGQFGLRVELISKVAEAAMTTLKKFQTQ